MKMMKKIPARESGSDMRYISDLVREYILYMYQNALTIPMKELASRAAPPMRPPSTSGLAKSWAALVGLQLPP